MIAIHPKPHPRWTPRPQAGPALAAGLGMAWSSTRSLHAASNGVITLSTNRPAAGKDGAQALHDIVGPVPLGAGWMWLARAAVALALLALGWWLWRRRQRRKALEAEPPPSPDETARRRLRDALLLLDQPRPFCFQVSEIVRVYLEERFHLKAPERTTEEFLDELRGSPRLASRHQELLADFLTRCDFAKFARYEPGRQELEDIHNAALRIVDETTAPDPVADMPDPAPAVAGIPADRPPEPPETGEPLPEGEARYQPRGRPATVTSGTDGEVSP